MGALRRYTPVIAAVIISMCSVIAFFPAVSDSYGAEQGSSAISFRTSSPLSEEDVMRLFDDPQVAACASDALFAMFIDSHDMNITDIKISNVSIEASTASRLDDDGTRDFYSYRYSMDISFKAEATADREVLTLCDSDIEDALRYLNDNRMSAGDRIEFSGHVTAGRAESEEKGYTLTEEGRFVNTDSCHISTWLFQAEDVSFRLICGERTMSLTVDSFREDNGKLYEEMDFPKGGAEAAKEGTSVLVDRWFRNSFMEEKFSFDGDVSQNYQDYWNNDEYNLINHYTESYDFYPAVFEDDLTYWTVSLYGTGPGHYLFSDVRDPSLASEDALRAFLSERGTVSDTFSDAEDIFDSVSETPSRTSIRRMMVIGSIGILVSVAALGLIFYYARKRRSEILR